MVFGLTAGWQARKIRRINPASAAGRQARSGSMASVRKMRHNRGKDGKWHL